MLMPLNNSDWQVLRTVLRAGARPPTGRELRLVPTRRTKDGSFLTDLVKVGLLREVAKADDPFETTYALTPLGEHAAEYGEYDRPLPPRTAAAERAAGGPVVKDAFGRSIIGAGEPAPEKPAAARKPRGRPPKKPRGG